MLYVIAIVNLLLGCFTFVYLFAETDPVADYLYAAMQGSIVLNILSIALLWKGWKNYSHNKKSLLWSSCFLAIPNCGSQSSPHRILWICYGINPCFSDES